MRAVSGAGTDPEPQASRITSRERKCLIINERNFDKINAMDRQCPWLPFMLVGVKWQQASEEDGGKGPRSGVRGRRSGRKSERRESAFAEAMAGQVRLR